MGPNHVHNVVDEAIRTALARRGVAHITIPKDIQEWTVESKSRSRMNIAHHSGDNFAPANPLPSRELLQRPPTYSTRARKWPSSPAAAPTARNEVLQTGREAGAPDHSRPARQRGGSR